MGSHLQKTEDTQNEEGTHLKSLASGLAFPRFSVLKHLPFFLVFQLTLLPVSLRKQ